MTSTQRVLTLVGDPNQVNTWSNIPYFFLKAGEKAGFLHQGLPLQPKRLKTRKMLWNGCQLLRTGRYGGFQYSSTCLKQLFSQVNLAYESVDIISHFPLLPPMPWPSSWKVSYYLDATTKQIFYDYGIASKVSPTVQKAALQKEKVNFQACDRVICMSPWAARSVVEDYQISPKKVHIIPGGANLNEENLPAPRSADATSAMQPLRLGFVGKDWKRKGLPYLLQIADVLSQQGLEVEVVVVGPKSQDLPKHPAIRGMGFLNKSTHLVEYAELVQTFHFGCLFSTAEAFGISNLECLRLGVPAIAHRVGGIPATLPDTLGHLFDLGTSPTVIAEVLTHYVENPSSYNSLRQRVARRAKDFSWESTVKKFSQLWHGSTNFSYEQL